jgi:hypothetical protein
MDQSFHERDRKMSEVVWVGVEFETEMKQMQEWGFLVVFGEIGGG